MPETPAQLLPNDTSTLNHAPWEAYHHPYVRDLAFVLACPNVLTAWLDFSADQNTHQINVHSSAFWLSQFTAYRARLAELDNTTAYQQLTRYLLSRPSANRLGFHFEGLLSFWLADGYQMGLHAYETLASNIQLYDDKQTIGELDLILYNHKENRTEHWELAIKFFMGSSPFAPKNWVGINSNDHLERKMAYMQNKQFRSIWVDTQDHGQVKIDKRYGVIKGRFFLPINHSDVVYPNWLTPSFPMHQWCDVRDDAGLAMIDITTLRPARYIEWFTKRDFYDKHQQSSYLANSTRPSAGLYFKGNEPLVIYPRQPTIENKRS